MNRCVFQCHREWWWWWCWWCEGHGRGRRDDTHLDRAAHTHTLVPLNVQLTKFLSIVIAIFERLVAIAAALEEGGNLQILLVFGLREREVGEYHAQQADEAEEKESSVLVDCLGQLGEELGDEEGAQPVDSGGARRGGTARHQRRELGNHQPWNWTPADGEADDEHDQADHGNGAQVGAGAVLRGVVVHAQRTQADGVQAAREVEQRLAAEARDEEATEAGDHHLHDGNDETAPESVELHLRLLEDGGRVEHDGVDARKLLQHIQHEGQNGGHVVRVLAVGRHEHSHAELGLAAQFGFDFGQLVRVVVAIAAQLLHRLLGLGLAILRQQPAGRLGHEEHEDTHQDGGDGAEQRQHLEVEEDSKHVDEKDADGDTDLGEGINQPVK